MKKTIVYFYSVKGNNRFLAEKIAEKLKCDVEEIRPRINLFPLMLLGLTGGIGKLKNSPGDFERVILCGPVFVGKFIAPFKKFIGNYGEQIRDLVFVTCCGSGYEQKDEKFGHGHVFNHLKKIIGEKCLRCEAFPISLVVPEELKKNQDTVLKTRLSEDNFNGEIKERFDTFISVL